MKKKLGSFLLITVLIFSTGFVPASAENEKLVLSDEFLSKMIRLVPAEEDGYLNWKTTDGKCNEVDLVAKESYDIPSFFSVDLPSSYDLRNVDGTSYVTSVKNQGSTNYCWSFSALGAAESNILKQNMAQEKWFTDSELRFSPLHLGKTAVAEKIGMEGLAGDYLTQVSEGTRAGNDMIAAASLSTGAGVQLETETPFSQLAYGVEGVQHNVSYYHLKDYSYFVLDNTNPSSAVNVQKRNTVKQWLMENGACTVGYYYSSSAMYQSGGEYSLYQSNQLDSNHASLIVGWDDNFSDFSPTNSPVGNGAWLVRNSHGTGSEKDGYFWLSYYDATIKTMGSVCMESAESYDNHYQYVGVLPLGGIGTGDSFITTAANMFTAKSAETLKAVGVFTMTEGLGYEITVYRGTTEDNPQSGTECETLNGVFMGIGYHSVPLETEVSLSEGETFSVVVSLAGENAYMPFESYGTAMYDGEEVGVGCRAGETYLPSGNAWYDVMNVVDSEENRIVGNAPIHAFTVNTDRSTDATELTAAVSTAKSRIGSWTTKPLGAPDVLWNLYQHEIQTAEKISKNTAAKQFEVNNAMRNLQASVQLLEKNTDTVLKYENGIVQIDSVKPLGEVLLIAASYSGQKLSKIVSRSVTLTGAATTEDISSEFQPQEGETVKLMLWSDWNKIQPLAAYAE